LRGVKQWKVVWHTEPVRQEGRNESQEAETRRARRSVPFAAATRANARPVHGAVSGEERRPERVRRSSLPAPTRKYADSASAGSRFQANACLASMFRCEATR